MRLPAAAHLIIEDEIVIAFDLQDAMSNLGFDVSDLAPSPNRAFSLAMSHKPDIVLMDVCLDGGREGIEAARWVREVCEVPQSLVYREGLADAVAEAIEHRDRLAHRPTSIGDSRYPAA